MAYWLDKKDLMVRVKVLMESLSDEGVRLIGRVLCAFLRALFTFVDKDA